MVWSPRRLPRMFLWPQYSRSYRNNHGVSWLPISWRAHRCVPHSKPRPTVARIANPLALVVGASVGACGVGLASFCTANTSGGNTNSKGGRPDPFNGKIHADSALPCYSATYAANNPTEDRYQLKHKLKKHSGSLFAVFDGHGGGECSQFMSEYLFDFIQHLSPPDAEPSGLLAPKAFQQADTYFLTEGLKIKTRYGGSVGQAGSCAIVAHVTDNVVTCANLGDCRVVIGRATKGWTGARQWQALALSTDHAVGSNANERARLKREHPGEADVCGERHDPRVKGLLQPSRAMGDGSLKSMDYFSLLPREYQAHFKQTGFTPPYVSSTPEITKHTLDKQDHFMVVASDGLFQDMSNEDVVAVVGACLDSGSEINISSELVKHALLAAGRHAVRDDSRPAEAVLDMVMTLPPKMKRNVHDDITVLTVLFQADQQATAAKL